MQLDISCLWFNYIMSEVIEIIENLTASISLTSFMSEVIKVVKSLIILISLISSQSTLTQCISCYTYLTDVTSYCFYE